MKRTLPYSLSAAVLIVASAVLLLTRYTHRISEFPATDDVTIPTDLVSSITDPTDRTTYEPAVSDISHIERPAELFLNQPNPLQIRTDGCRIAPHHELPHIHTTP